jgi:two-component system, NarL family, response regulator NreC
MNTRVLIIHQSAIIAEGLQKLLQHSSLQLHDHLRIYMDPAEINLQPATNYIFISTDELFQKLYSFQLIHFPEANYRFIKLINESPAISDFECDGIIHLDETPNQIVDKIRCATNSFLPEKTTVIGTLTERETEILKLVALGNASKEIADKLNISTHTVITHRKNITEKLGIKSISGLTVYAILNKIIDTNELSIDDLI